MNLQEEMWKGEFGDEYAFRNPSNIEEINKLYIESFGVNRKELNEEFIGKLDKNIRILEVGCNTGAQLSVLKEMGFKNLYGIELSMVPLIKAKTSFPEYNLIQGNATDIPFKDNYFDLVYTSGVLIHIHKDNLGKAIDEIFRVSNKYIWGFEYFSEKREMINYRGRDNVLWKDDFAKNYLDKFNNLNLLKRKKIKYLSNDNYDEMFLLEKL